MRNSLFLLVLIGCGSSAVADNDVPAHRTEASPEAIEFFEKQVRPLFAKHCYECHSTETGPDNGELILDTAAGIDAGGTRGSLVAGKETESSLLWNAVNYNNVDFQMPPEGKLPQKELDILAEWIRLGAPIPEATEVPRPAGKQIDIEAGREFWSFQPLKSVEVPQVEPAHWIRQPLDAFILKRLHEVGLAASREAERRTLIRRVTFDLTGLPPHPEDVEAFASDESPNSYARLVDRLLDSPQFGEHWGRFWLDLVRYADVLAVWHPGKGHSWLYRDWVVEAFNANRPYDEFVRLQLAADLIPESKPSDHAALGFLGISPTYWKELQLAPEVIAVIVADEWEERVDAVTRTFLGLTVACARCHDHKFDPITMEDYYGLAGIFASSQSHVRPLLPNDEAEAVMQAHRQVEQHRARIKQLEGEIGQLAAQIKQREETAANSDANNSDAENDPGDEEPLQEIRQRKSELEANVAELKEQIEAIRQETPHFDIPWGHVMREASLYVKPNGENATRLDYVEEEPRDLPLFRRGNPSNPGPIVPRRFPQVLSGEDFPNFTQGSGRRELADALFDQSSALTARVFVNRVWAQLFGTGLVRTPSNFGRQGEPPTHPELLDFLSGDFIAHGWDVKRLIREIVLSSTYRQAVRHDPRGAELDPDNRLLWRMNRKRLSFEMWRDAMLACGGTLDLTLGGESLPLEAGTNQRRTLYATIARRDLNPTLRMFDFPEASSHSPQRVPTTTPLQQLYVLNSPFVRKQAEQVVSRLPDDAPTEERIERCYQILFGRQPTPDELDTGLQFLQVAGNDQPTTVRWRDFVHALLGLNEFIYLD